MKHRTRLLVHHQNPPFGIQHQDPFDHAAQDGIGFFLFRHHLRQIVANLEDSSRSGVVRARQSRRLPWVGKKVLRKGAARPPARKTAPDVENAESNAGKKPRPEAARPRQRPRGRQEATTKSTDHIVDVRERHGHADDSFLAGAGLMEGAIKHVVSDGRAIANRASRAGAHRLDHLRAVGVVFHLRRRSQRSRRARGRRRQLL